MEDNKHGARPRPGPLAWAALLGLLATAALASCNPAAALDVVPADASVVLPDSRLTESYTAVIAARAGQSRRSGVSLAAAGPRDSYVVELTPEIAASLDATRNVLTKLSMDSECEVLGLVAHLPGHYLVECPRKSLSKRSDLLSQAGVVDVELQIPQRRIFKRKPVRPIPEKDPRFEFLSDEWKEELRERIEDNERDAAAFCETAESRLLVKRSLMTQTEVRAAWSRLGLTDPGLRRQWHLFNNGTPSADLNVTGVWDEGITGKGSIVCVIDDGLDHANSDLTANFYLDGSWDFNNPEQAPSPQPQNYDDNHGTRCAGQIAAVRNDVCGVGVAYDAQVAGVRILSAPLTNADEASASNYEYQKNQIYSCSWGPTDDGASLDRPTTLSQRSYVEAVTNGRDGKGSIYVFAAGNGGENYDSCNYDGFVNQIYVIGIGSVDYMDRRPSYSEACTALHAVTYSSSSPQAGPSIYTTDDMPNQCTAAHTGTSASAPLAAGIFALCLEANPNLTWRDAQQLIYETAIPVQVNDASWDRLAAGKMYSPKFGFGKLDAWRMVEAAKTFVTLPAQTSLNYIGRSVQRSIPHGAVGISDTITVSAGLVSASNLALVEHVQVWVTMTHPARGQVRYELTSPSGIVSVLGETRPYDVSSQGLNNWTFSTLKYWGDRAEGDWVFTIRDPVDSSKTGSLESWGLKIWGAEERDAQVVPTSTSRSRTTTTRRTTLPNSSRRTTTTDAEPSMSMSMTPSSEPDVTSAVMTRPTRTINVTSPIAAPLKTTTRTGSGVFSNGAIGGRSGVGLGAVLSLGMATAMLILI